MVRTGDEPRDDLGQRDDEPRDDIGWRGFLQDTRDVGWIYLIVPILLTAFFAALSRDPGARLLDQLLFCVVITVVTGTSQSAFYTLLLARFAEPAQHGRAMVLRMVAVALGVVIGAEVAIRVFAAMGGISDLGAMRVEVLKVSAIVTVAIFVVGVALDRVHARRREAEKREAALRQHVLRAQLSALKARTNPHFLFNALNTVASLIEDRPEDAERAVETLSALFRYALDASSESSVTVQDELDAVRGYLDVERLRFGERLGVEHDIDQAVLSASIPPLTLQPLVENAIRHGITQRRGGGTVWITVRREPVGERVNDEDRISSNLVLRVEDDGVGPGGSTRQAGSGTALRDLEERLRLSYPGRGAVLVTGAGSRGGFVAEVRVPHRASAGVGVGNDGDHGHERSAR